jgi:hypothetical protein
MFLTLPEEALTRDRKISKARATVLNKHFSKHHHFVAFALQTNPGLESTRLVNFRLWQMRILFFY